MRGDTIKQNDEIQKLLHKDNHNKFLTFEEAMKAFQKHSQKNALRLLTEKEESKQTENTSKVDAISKRNKPFLRSFEDVLTPPERNERLDTKSSTPHHQTMSSNKPQTSKIKETRSESSSSQSSDKEYLFI